MQSWAIFIFQSKGAFDWEIWISDLGFQISPKNLFNPKTDFNEPKSFECCTDIEVPLLCQCKQGVELRVTVFHSYIATVVARVEALLRNYNKIDMLLTKIPNEVVPYSYLISWQGNIL